MPAPHPDARAVDPQSVAAGLHWRVLLPLAIGILLAIAIGFGALLWLRHHQEAYARKAALASLDVMLEERARQDVLAMQSMIGLLMNDQRLQASARAGDRAALLAATAPFMSGLRNHNSITHLYFHRPDRSVLLRVHHPQEHGDVIERDVLVRAQESRAMASGYEQGPLGSYTLRVAMPWQVDGELLGYVEMGVEFDVLLAGIARALDVEVLVALKKSIFDREKWENAGRQRQSSTRWDEFPQVVLLSPPAAPLPPAVAAFLGSLGSGGPPFGRVADDDRVLHLVSQPLRNMRGQVVGDVVMVKDVSEMTGNWWRSLIVVVASSLGIGCVLILFVYFVLERLRKSLASRTVRLAQAQRVLAAEQVERHRAEQELVVQQERNQLLEMRSRMVEELAQAKRVAEEALRQNEDVTAKLIATQSELMEAARAAGRAEIATNVLHNVGNVLNSVNVSAGVLGSGLRSSRVVGLARAVQMMAAHAADLGSFITSDAKGRLLPGYFAQAVEALEQERQALLEEVSRLTKSVDHIKDIVATQQAHAATSTVIEAVPPSEPADEALRMQGSALARHNVTVLRHYEALPPVPLDRGRVLQILNNLISNAKQALVDVTDGRPHEIIVRVERSGDRLRYSVQDRGEGIAPENLTRIFSHGFTTRPSGHGFGLHSSALAARQLGGTLKAHSDGPGRGATFVLELPMAPGDPAGAV